MVIGSITIYTHTVAKTHTHTHTNELKEKEIKRGILNLLAMLGLRGGGGQMPAFEAT